MTMTVKNRVRVAATLWLAMAVTEDAEAAAVAPTPFQAALQAGADAAAPCRQQIDDDAYEFLECVQVRARPAARRSRLDDARRLGALFQGWVSADVAAGYAVEGAETAASTLLRVLLPLQKQLDVKDRTLCSLQEVSCVAIINRKREVLASPAFKAGSKTGR